jgi:hypothetical protein
LPTLFSDLHNSFNDPFQADSFPSARGLFRLIPSITMISSSSSPARKNDVDEETPPIFVGDNAAEFEIEGKDEVLEQHYEEHDHDVDRDISQMVSSPEIRHQPGQKLVQEQDKKMRDLMGHFLQSPQGQGLIRNAVSPGKNPFVSSFAPSSVTTKTQSSNTSVFIKKKNSAYQFPITSTKQTAQVVTPRLSSTSGLDADTKFPKDSYSFIALNGPKGKSWPIQKKLFFYFWIGALSLSVLLAIINDRKCSKHQERNHRCQQRQS